jgi:cohesin complex subunit SA-1/2
MEAEKKKGRVNKGRVADLQKNLDATNKKRETLDSIIKDIFDTVFVHRYRDVDPKIRVDCIQALGLWITTLPDIFFEGTYLRYMGWVLSDTSGQTRAEVVRQLQRLFNDKDNIAGLRTFTERFRPRLVEMATRDADINVRVLAIELLDSVRDAGFLEPDDIDVIGKLLFDSEPRVRKAVAGFFVENIQDLYDTKIDELGGEEAVEEALARDDEEDYDHPRLSWIKLKCLVEVLQAYDSEDDDLEINEAGFLVATGVESRFALAAQALYDKVPEIKEWEVLAGYILYDHSETSSKPRKKDDVEKVLKRECKLDEQEEIVLLEVLNAVVTLSILHAEGIDPSKKGKKTKALRTEATESGEAITRHLADLIPRLLNKFGALPAAASIVLRLEHALNLEVFHQLRQDTTYAALLDDINKQFLSHGNQSVLAEASAALLHAKGFEDLEEVTEEKVQHLWQDTTQTLQALVTGQNLQERGNMTSIILSGLTSTVRRISNLASVSDCIEVFEKIPSSSSKRRKTGDRNSPPLQSLINLVSRGILSNDDMLDEEVEALEEDLSSTAMQAVLFYFMWKVRSLQAGSPAGTAVSSEGTSTLNSFRKEFSETLHNILETRSTTDTVRVNAAGTLLDLHTLFATLRHFRTSAAPSDPMSVLITQISHGSTEQLTSLFTSLEKAYSKKAHRSLEQPADDDEPEDLEASDDEDEDDADETQKAANSVLAAEQRLCEYTAKLVLAIIARVLDTEGDSKQKQKLRKRLERNKGRLGPNFKEVIAHLEQADGKKRPKKGIRGRGPAESARATSKSAAKVVESEGEGEGEDEDDPIEEGGEEDLRRRELLVEDEVEPDSPEPELQDEIEDEIMGD